MRHYTTKLAELQAEATVMDPYGNEGRLTQFTLFSANLLNFLPSLSVAEHITLFKDAFLSQRLNGLEQAYFDDELPFEVNGWADGLSERMRSEPGIICTLHLGSYRLINYLLAKAGIPFAILMSRQASNAQASGFKELYRTLRNGHPQAQLDIIEAEDARALWKLIGCLKQGMNVLVYLDGYTGLPAQRNQLVEIPFMAQHLLVRKGAAFLASRLERPLYPIVAVRDEGRNVLVKAGKPILGHAISDRVWPELALTHLYAFFGSVIMHHPAQWESWFFLHKQLRLEQVSEAGKLKIGKHLPAPDDFGIICLGDDCYLMEKKGYRTVKIDRRLSAGLMALWSKIRENGQT